MIGGILENVERTARFCRNCHALLGYEYSYRYGDCLRENEEKLCLQCQLMEEAKSVKARIKI